MSALSNIQHICLPANVLKNPYGATIAHHFSQLPDRFNATTNVMLSFFNHKKSVIKAYLDLIKNQNSHDAVSVDVSQKNIFSASHLQKKYGNKQVLKDFSFALKRGEAVALLGPNGAGKTTSFYILSGLLMPDAGDIFMDGVNITALPIHIRARLGLSYLPQEASIFRGLTVEENIKSIVQINVADKQQWQAKTDELLQDFSLTDLRQSPAPALSGGERRRLEIARALAANPSYILLDEPLAGVDPIAVKDIQELILRLKKRNVGVLITDHNVRETLKLVDRAYVIYDGAVLLEGSADQIINNQQVRDHYLGDDFRM